MHGLLRTGTYCFALGLAVALAQPGGAAAQDGPQKALTVVSWGGSYTRSQMLAYVKPYRQESGEWVAMETYSGGLKEIREQVETENVVWDVVDFELSDLLRGCREGLLEKIDPGFLAPGADGASPAEDFIPGALSTAASARPSGPPWSATTRRLSRARRRAAWPTSSTSRSSRVSAA